MQGLQENRLNRKFSPSCCAINGGSITFMTYYFCLSEALSQCGSAEENPDMEQVFIRVSQHFPAHASHEEDVFTLDNAELLDFGDEEGSFNLTALLTQNPLYRINAELLMDQALTDAKNNEAVEVAIKSAFSPHPLPETIENQQNQGLEGNLQHPALAHMTDAALSQCYCRLVESLPVENIRNYALPQILRQHTVAFLESFDGYKDNAGTFIIAKKVFYAAHRNDYDAQKPIENYIDNGREKATSMGLKTFDDIASAYLKAEEYQLRRATDIENAMTCRWDQIPNWIRQDIFALLEQEAMKQVFALHLVEGPDFAALFKTRPALKDSIAIHAEGHVEAELQQLLSETLNENSGYSGSASRFAAKVQKRLKETEIL